MEKNQRELRATTYLAAWFPYVWAPNRFVHARIICVRVAFALPHDAFRRNPVALHSLAALGPDPSLACLPYARLQCWVLSCHDSAFIFPILGWLRLPCME
jgi:hypothetical protein